MAIGIQSIGSLTSEYASESVALTFLDIKAIIRSDSKTFLDRLRANYASFIELEPTPSSSSYIECGLFVGRDNPWKKPSLFVGEAHFFVPDRSALPEELLLSAIITRLLNQVRDYYLFHAGVVAKDEQAIVIAADSNHGKSTLVYELVRRGAQFYSDDTAPIGRRNGRVSPFPRTLQLRPEVSNVIALDNLDLQPVWRYKYLLKSSGKSTVRLNDQANICAIIFLRDPAKTNVPNAEALDLETSIVVEQLKDGLLEAIYILPDLAHMSVSEIQGYPVLRVIGRKDSYLIQQVIETCRDHGVEALYVANNLPERPSFDNTPFLQPLSRSQSALELLQHLQTGKELILKTDKSRESALRLYTDIAGLLGTANCYYLDVGPLQEMADLVMTLFEDHNH